jgi:hypothetical protein
MISLNPDSLKQWQDENLEHLRYEYDVKPGELIIDIGSYHREWSNEMINRYGCVAECFDVLDNRGAWTHDTKIRMGGAYYYTSMHENGESWFDCVDIAPYLQKEIAVLKMNIEGGEYELLRYIIDCGIMKNIRNLQVQFHLVDGLYCDDLYELLRNILIKTHSLSWRYPFCWESWELKQAA